MKSLLAVERECGADLRAFMALPGNDERRSAGRLSCHIRSSRARASASRRYISRRCLGGRPASPVEDGATCAEIVVASNVARGRKVTGQMIANSSRLGIECALNGLVRGVGHSVVIDRTSLTRDLVSRAAEIGRPSDALTR